MARIIIVSTAGESLIKFRGHLIREWVKRNNEVWCISIESPSEIEMEIKKLGASYYQVSGNRTGTSIFDGFGMIRRYEKAFREINPDIVFLYMSKPIAFGGIAAIRSNIKNIFVFQTGLEIAFYSDGLKNLIIRNILKVLYRYVQNRSDCVFFMCHEDQEKMIKWKLVKETNTCYVDGSGVDMSKFTRQELPNDAVVLMVARLVWSKGIREYLEAATILKKDYPDSRFMLVGGLDENSEALTKDELDEVVNQGIIEYKGYQNDVRPYLKDCSIFVLPSYHEGKGTAILEAQAVGRPIVTTDAPGCKETVIPDYNGLIAKVKDSHSLAEKIGYFIKYPDERVRMAENAYEHCKNTFEAGIISKKICEIMGL